MGRSREDLLSANTYTAITKQDADWWVGWIEEVPGVNCQERTREDLLSSLRVTLKRLWSSIRREGEYDHRPVAKTRQGTIGQPAAGQGPGRGRVSDYLETAASRDATAELLKMPGLLGTLKRPREIKGGRFKDWRKVPGMT